MLKELKTLFAQQAEKELLQTMRDFHSSTKEPSWTHSQYALEIVARILNMFQLKRLKRHHTEYGMSKLSYLKVLGCEALVKRDTLNKPDKLESMSIKCIFVGYPKETMSYSFYYPSENKVIVARNADFLNNSRINKEASGSLKDLEIIQEEDTHPSRNG
nr:hypothetical protein [Tanacetum cinerariifolium]